MTVTQDAPRAVPPDAMARRPRMAKWSRRRSAPGPAAPAAQSARRLHPEVDPADPLLPHLLAHPVPAELDTLPAFSPAVRRMREDGVRMVVPLVASGELVGLLVLGDRLSERGYSRDDRTLLANLARHAAPALRVGNLVRQQEVEARNLQRIESELQVAQLIQQHFLPSQLPSMHGWQVDAFYRPARTVGGDFYDIIELPDGRIMVVAGDVTDKGVPAALVMASTYSLLRAAAQSEPTPGAVLHRVNELLHPQIPVHMFVTCLVLFIDPASGAMRYANAGHNLPYRCRDGAVQQLDARGMPLGLMPGSTYDEHQDVLAPGDVLVLYSDGITEQHDAAGEMFGFERMAAVVRDAPSGTGLVDGCMAELTAFSGEVEQEDDITLVAVTRPMAPGSSTLRCSIAAQAGNEREAMDRVLAFVGDVLPTDRAQSLGTAVAEAVMNAIEHGNRLDPELPVDVAVTLTADLVRVAVTDRGAGAAEVAQAPDLDAKLAGLQPARGWGLFLIEQLVDTVVDEVGADGRHTVTLTMARPDDGQPAGGGR
jgi:serine phosphatase RsbU (regulator of sigma subunit)/anti-sigma regulatory factor (Ser/Thr protein kinase)